MTPTPGADAAMAAAIVLRRNVAIRPHVGLILGSGLSGIAAAIESPVRIPFRDVPGFPDAAVAGHAGEVVAGILGGTPVVAMAGRFHMYEGHAAALAAFPVRVLHALGARTLIVSNAAGGTRESFSPGTIMLIRDHLNLTFRNPLTGRQERGDMRFPDMSEPYDVELRTMARDVARSQGFELAEGVYAAQLGPSYETRAEIRMLVRLGAHAVGMSTVPEVIVARALGMRVLGLSCVTNFASGLSSAPITHDEVLSTTARVAGQVQRLVLGIVARL